MWWGHWGIQRRDSQCSRGKREGSGRGTKQRKGREEGEKPSLANLGQAFTIVAWNPWTKRQPSGKVAGPPTAIRAKGQSKWKGPTKNMKAIPNCQHHWYLCTDGFWGKQVSSLWGSLPCGWNLNCQQSHRQALLALGICTSNSRDPTGKDYF